MKAFRGNAILTDHDIEPKCILVDKGTIAAVLDTLPEGFQGEIIDTGDKLLMPGLVDCHVHINEPGRTEWEGYHTATRSAAAGGITTLVDMPLNCSPVTTSREALEIKMQAVAGKCWVDCGFWGGVTPQSLDHLPGLLEAGVLGVKSFLINSGLDEFPHVEECHLRAAMPLLTEAGLPYLIHAELDDGKHRSMDRTYRSFLESRPRSFENRAIDTMIALCRETGCRTHIVHLSSADALPAIEAARSEGLPFTAETCPHYLVLESETIGDGQTQYKCCPPIREAENRDRLWQGLQRGVLDFVVSDHSPCTPELKCLEDGDLARAWGGVSSLQFGLPLIWTEARQRGISLQQVSQWMSARVADFIGLKHQKGRIAAGYDADFVVWDPEASFSIEPNIIYHRHKLTPYSGRAVNGKIHQTWLAGECVFGSTGFAETPRGRFLLQSQNTSVETTS